MTQPHATNGQEQAKKDIKAGVQETMPSPTKGEETSSAREVLMSILLERIETGELGLRALVKQFEQQNPVKTNSWLGTGGNAELSAAEVELALGAAELESIAKLAGIPPNEVSAELATVLPELIDKFTPGGKLPETETARRAASDLRTSS